tara:strand:- start:141 stop:563 length:423 start_codon:yes stop_codon:yes gene_type:complete
MKDEPKTCWQGSPSKSEKPWGYEVSWASLLGVCGKVLFINKDHSTSFKYYLNKDEVLLVRRGRVRILWGDENSTLQKYPSEFNSVNLKEGDSFCIQSGCPYRITAEEDSEIFEIGSSAVSSKAIMLFDEYGRVNKPISRD